MKRVLITGGLGFIGMALTRRLVAAGTDVLILDVMSPQIHGEVPHVDVPDGARVVRLDVRDLASRTDLVDDQDVVFHLAAETGTGQSMYQIARYVDVNDGGMAGLLEAISRCSRKPRRIVLASSRSVYGEGAYIEPGRPDHLLQPMPRTREQLDAGMWEPVDSKGRTLTAIATPETLGYAPGSVYAATKASQELLLNSAASALGFKAVVLRFQNVYGEGQSLQNPYTGIISIFFNRARQGMDIPIYEDGAESRDFVHVEDVVTALQRAMEADVPPGTPINVGSGEPTSVLALARVLTEVAGMSVGIRVTGQFRVGDIRHCFADLTRARDLLGYCPAVKLVDGLGRFTQWAVRQPIHEDRLGHATEELRKKGLAN